MSGDTDCTGLPHSVSTPLLWLLKLYFLYAVSQAIMAWLADLNAMCAHIYVYWLVNSPSMQSEQGRELCGILLGIPVWWRCVKWD